MDIQYQCLTGNQIVHHLSSLAQLRLTVFQEYPYLYQGDMDEEAKYLKDYADSPSSLTVFAYHDTQLIGASTAMKLENAAQEFRLPFEHYHEKKENIFYFGESVLLAPYRGKGIGRRFFDLREQHAITSGANICVFCAVDRPVNHPCKPEDYRDLEPFWQRRGYIKQPHLQAQLAWKERPEQVERNHTLTFWQRTLS